MAGHGLRLHMWLRLRSALLFSLSFVRCASVEFALGALADDVQLHAAAAAALIDYQKNFNASLAARLGPPIIQIPGGVHPNASMGAIRLNMKDDGSSDKTGMAEALNLLLGLEGNFPPVIGLVGPGSSKVATPVATLGGVRQIPQISCCAKSPKLSDKKEYPFFIRTMPPDTFLATAIWHWVLHFNVATAACVYSDEGYGQSLFGTLNDLARANGQQDRIQGQGLGQMRRGFDGEQARKVIKLVKQIGSHFVILLAAVSVAEGLLNILEEEGMLTPAWQILSTDTLLAASGRTVGYMYLRPAGDGAKVPELQQLWSRLSPRDMQATDQMQLPAGLVGDEMFDEGVVFRPQAIFNFDSVYAYFIAINNLLHSGMDATEVRGRALYDEMSRLRFNGVSGDMSFDRNGDRLGVFELLNTQSDGSIVSVASFSAKTLNFTVTDPLTWMDGSVGYSPPPDMYSCDPGFYQEEQTRQCKRCPQGNFCEGGLTGPLIPCPRGTFAPDVGMTNCTACPKGSFALDAGAAECVSCQPGTEGPFEGMEICRSCEVGFFMPFSGSNQCLPCGKNQITPGLGSTSESDCVCAEGSFMCPSEGCIPCPTGLLCPEGLGPPEQAAGFWTDSNASQCDFSVLRCRDRAECPQGPLGRCSEGRVGQACNNCEPGYYSRGSTCERCREGDTMPVILVLILLLALLAFVSNSNWDPSQVSLNTVTAASVTSQLLMAIQSLGSIRELSISWQEPVATLINLTKLVMFDFHFIRTSCFFGTDNPVLYFVGRLITCPVACALLLCAWVLQKMLGRPKPFNTVLNQCGVMIFAFFLSITRATLIPFQCVQNPNGTSSMMLHPGIICYQSEEHTVFAGLAVLGVVTQPLAVLVLATYVILTYPSRVASGKGLRFSTRYRFLLHRFKPSSYYYGLVLLYRNAIVALLPTVLVGVPEVQVPLMGIMLLAVQNLSLQTAPWRTQMANRIDMLLTDLLLVTLLSAGPLLLIDEASSTAVLGWLLCVPILSILLVALLGFLKLAVRAIRQKREKLYDIFLCHHKAGGGSLSRLMKLVILKHSSARVFLDSDQLQNLDLLFDIIRTSAKNVVVVLTGELLSRSWCAGEIVTAWKNDVHTVPLLCDGFARLSDEAQKQIPALWTPHQIAQLASYGILLEDVNLAYAWLQHELTPLQMSRFGPVHEREKVVLELMNVCGLPSRRTTSKTAGHVSRPRILIMSSFMEAEYLSACEVFQILLQAHLHVECEVVHDVQQIATCKPFAYYLIVLLFRGILRDQDFIKLLLYATQTCTSSKRALELVPVVADSNFEVPSVDTMMKKFGCRAPPGGLAHQDQVFRNFCTVLALPFTPLASEGLQERQVAEIASRIHRYQDPATAAPKDESEDQLLRPRNFQLALENLESQESSVPDVTDDRSQSSDDEKSEEEGKMVEFIF